MGTLDLLDACEHCYYSAQFSAGPDGRDGASVVRISGQTALVFRGTLTAGAVGMLDWLNDLRAELVYRPEYRGRVHAGFAASIDSLWPRLPVFRGPITIAGHSKGGALALLMGARLATEGVRARVVAFAAPKVGDEQFARFAGLNLDIDCHENPHDLVPHLPPLDYRQPGYRISPPATWRAPRGVVENHSIAHGYRPWVEETQPRPALAAA